MATLALRVCEEEKKKEEKTNERCLRCLRSILRSGETQTYNKLHLPTSRCRYEAARESGSQGVEQLQLHAAKPGLVSTSTHGQIFLHLDTFGSNVRKFHWVSKS